MEYRTQSARESLGKAPEALAQRPSAWIERAVALALRLAMRPYAATAGLFAANLAAIGLMIGAGELVFGDPAEPFRELMPGTWLSVAQLAFVAITAWAIHRRLWPGARLRLDNFWGASVAVFTIFAIDEATQLTIFAAHWLKSAGAVAPWGLADLDAFLLGVLLLAGAVALLRFGATLLAHPGAVVLMTIGVALGLASQLLDSTREVTSSEIVAEESLKLAAEPFLIGGYLLALHQIICRRSTG